MQFVHQTLTWGFLLAFVPVLIHLINLVRRRRIRWAAMDFLQQSYRKHRKWIWLKQLLLLLARMAIVALIVAMLAQWVSRQQWSALLGGGLTHHYVLLDDSFSMSERAGAGSAMDSAKRAISQIAAQAIARQTPQKFTLIRFSRAAAPTPQEHAGAVVARIADLNGESVDARFDELLEERQRPLEPTPLAVGPRDAIELLNHLVEENKAETSIVYVVSDFRENQWSQPAELRKMLRETQQFAEAIHFVRCSKQPQPNLAIIDLKPGDETRAAGVPLFVYVSVRNFGTQPARRVPVGIRTIAFDPQVAASSEPGRSAGKIEEPPAVLIDEIPPGQTVTRRVQVYFPQPGAQVVEATLPEDAVAADNRRWCVLNLPDGEPVLVIDGSLNQRQAYFLNASFQPGQRANSGIRPEVQPPSMLRDADVDALKKYRAIYLADVDQLDERSVTNLEDFVRNGGGVGVFVGEHFNAAAWNQRAYRDGKGFFPLPIERADALPPQPVENVADLEVQDHPIFTVFSGQQSSFLRLVRIERYLKPPADWKPAAQSTVRVLASLRNHQPMVVERQLGAGRVVVFLSTLAPDWNNWAHDPTFVVVALKLQAYLASARHEEPEQLVGTPIRVELDTRKFRKEVAFVKPGLTPDQSIVVKRVAAPVKAGAPEAVAVLGSASDVDAAVDTQRSGVYEAWPVALEGAPQIRRFALNVDQREGNLAAPAAQSLRDRLLPVKVTVSDADELADTTGELAGYNRGLMLMVMLLALMLGEQWLAYSASYHPAKVLSG